jgi:mevalonate kinase
VILFGEHAVVYGEPAVAAALSDLCVHVLVTPMPVSFSTSPFPSSSSSQTPLVRVCLDDLGIYAEFDASAVWALEPHLTAPPTRECAQAIESRLLTLPDDPDKDLAASALTPLLYLVATMLPSSSESMKGGLDILVQSRSLPLGAGLGSSAAFSTALAAALLQLAAEGGGRALLGVPDAASLQSIERFAYYSEQLLHGSPSGIDNAVSAYGGAIVFQRATDATSANSVSSPPILTRLPSDMRLVLPPMMLVNTGVPRSTKALVAHVREQADRHPVSVRAVLRAMGLIASEFVGANLQAPDAPSTTATDASRILFFEQIRLNQDLLRSVGVSHPVIEAICETVSDAGGETAAAKLTGAGGGGCVIVAFSEDSSAAVQAALKRKFPSLAFLHTQIGGQGVRWISPDEVCSLVTATATAGHSCDDDRSRSSFLWMLAVGSLAVGAALIGVRGFSRRSDLL